MAQWNKKTQDFLDQERSLFEVYNIADHWGNQTDWRPQFTNNNRFKISPFQTVFFNTFQYGKETDVWDERIVGVGTATFNVNASNIVMQVGSTAGSKVIRQTKNVMRYIPGRGATLAFSIRLDTPQVGIRRRFGLFDDNNGIFFEDNGGTYSYVIRSSVTGIVTETRVTRDNWNGDKFDGNGYTGITGDPTKQQMISINYEWYGAGIVQFAWLMKNETVASHTFENSNTNPGVWCSTPFLPIRCDPIISLRLKSNNLGAVMLLRSLQAATDDNTNIYWELVENATLTGGTWVNHPDPNSFMQYNITQTAVSGGNPLLQGFVINGSGALVDLDVRAALQLGRSGIGTISDTYTLACASPNANKKALAVLNWIEQR